MNNTVTFGLVSVPFLAVRCLEKLSDEGEKYPVAAQLVKKDLYVDNLLSNQINRARSKGTILSEIAKIFDPLGLLGPIILYAKSIMQDICTEKLDWNESVSSSIYTA